MKGSEKHADVLLRVQASAEPCMRITKMLELYCQGAGQQRP